MSPRSKREFFLWIMPPENIFRGILIRMKSFVVSTVGIEVRIIQLKYIPKNTSCQFFAALSREQPVFNFTQALILEDFVCISIGPLGFAAWDDEKQELYRPECSHPLLRAWKYCVQSFEPESF